ncbi:MAG TPA: acyltransferase [Dinghuibacter sp.]|jgi:peptidoglycan/LPS O-acetylase OafA/YrhL|uniref:acyltransferase family protein n=1 Tax=Dinghuibacter sp. TaxID=2024697 RepID=UPI002C1241BE|nr:acyltransferase [Dinghuibacter sp.]HTJ13067.1 acyltransferase [Dinghuibacter sp.]
MKAKLPSLNGLRALSILFVLIGHTELKSLHLSGDPAGAQIGVTIFFIISGFLITYLLMREEQASDGRVSLKDFYIRRAFRIFPVYYTLLLVYLILQVLGFLQFTTASWISSLTYTKYVNPRWSEWETGHLWSLSVEEQFYLVWPAVFYFLKRVRAPLAVAVIAVIPFVRLGGGYNAMHMFTRADALMGGCLLALYYERLRGALAKLPRAYLLLPFAGLLGSMMTKRIITLFFHENTQVERIAIAFGGSYGTLTANVLFPQIVAGVGVPR